MLYFDNASTTRISKQSLKSFNNACEYFYNPSALYGEAVISKRLLDEARNFFIKYFSCPAGSTFIFTGSASESNNSVIHSIITRKDKKYLVGGGEHSSVYEPCKKLIEEGYNIKFINLNSNGSIDIHDLANRLDENVAGVIVMHVSNETGAINDIKTICDIVKSYNKNILVHSDGVQAVGKLDINLKDLGVDFYTMSAHKINGPKGIGGLYIANPNKFKPFILGGEQEFGLRAGTENLPNILAFKTAIENLEYHDFSQHKNAFINNLSGSYCLVSTYNCVDNIISVCFRGVRGETLEHILEAKGYIIGTGSACNSKAKTNRIISQIVRGEYQEGAVRISFDDSVTIEDCKNLAIELSIEAENYISRIRR